MFCLQGCCLQRVCFPFKHWISKSTPIPSFSSSDSMFPPQSVLPKSSTSPVSTDPFTLSVSAEFTPAFTTNIATPPNEFPDLVPYPSALEQSHYALDLPVLPNSISPPPPSLKENLLDLTKHPLISLIFIVI